jgi:ABC-2 type transport system permease protein
LVLFFKKELFFMSAAGGFSWRRGFAMLAKETTQMRRDPATLAMAVVLPLIQLFLFGSAINTNPKHLPTALLVADQSREVRDITTALQNTDYFALTRYPSEAAANAALARGEVLFVLNIPADFTRRLVRGEHPELLLDADATDSVAIAAAAGTLPTIAARAVTRDLPVTVATDPGAPFSFNIHARYNPAEITAYSIIPGLIGVVLTFSTLILTTIAITRERETGTMETLLALPLTPLEVMFGKIVPYIGLGYVQLLTILLAAVLVFGVPVEGSLALLLGAVGLFIACNLALGFTFSTIARTQMQAQQMAMFAILPSMLLSGFMFPFAGMPRWAQVIGEAMPLTHIVRICRGILLKGLGPADIVPELIPLAIFAAIAGGVALWFYRTTLD